MLRRAREQAEMTEEDVAEMVRRETDTALTAAQVHEAENPHEEWPGRIDHLRAEIASVLLGGTWTARTVFEEEGEG